MHFIGKLNRKIYSCITEDIVTDDVIITDNQIEHIMERHKDSYAETINFLEDVIADPDYIIKDR